MGRVLHIKGALRAIRRGMLIAVTDGMEPARRLDAPVDEDIILRLCAAGLLTDEARDTALDWVRPRHRWALWSQRLLLAVGTALLLAGTIYFFAFNWARMPVAVKLGLPQAGIMACVGLALWRGVERMSGQMALVGASVLTGVALAVFGQVYQTGADAYQLFVAWAALITGWVLLGRSTALWCLWLILVNLSLTLYWGQVVEGSRWKWTSLFLLLGVIDGLALVATEFLRNVSWLRARWLQRLLLAATLFWLTLPSLVLIMDRHEADVGGPLSALALALSLGGGYAYYRHRARDLAALTTCALSASSVAVTLAGKVMFEISDGAGTFLIMGLFTIGLVAAAVLWLAHLHRTMREEHDAA